MGFGLSKMKHDTVKGFNKGRIMFVIALFVLVAVAGSVNSQFGSSYTVIGSSNVQYYQPSFSSSMDYTSPRIYWPEFDRETCMERQDFIVQVAPGGCQPAVVRSDLLEEQNVPVFCKLMLIQTNPLIDVSRVKSIRFTGKYPEGVAGVSYFPSRFNIMRNRRDLADTPIDDNVGYFVVNLKRQPGEEEMPDWVEGDLTAVINYDMESALGIGKTSFYVSELNDEDWLRDYKEYSFWKGKGYIRTESIEGDRVSVSVYRDFDTKQSSVTLKKGETSPPIYLPGFYCAAGLEIRVEDIITPVETALLQIDGEQVWVAEDDRILDNKCSVREVETSSGGGKISISCPVGRFDLRLNPGKVTLEVDGIKKEYHVGERLDVAGKNIFVGYVGKKGGKFAVLINDTYSDNEIEFEDKGIYSIVADIIEGKEHASKTELDDDMGKEIKDKIVRKVKDGSLKDENILIIKDNSEKKDSYFGMKIGFMNATIIENKDWNGGSEKEKLAKEYYDKATEKYIDLADFYPQEKRIDGDYFEPYAAEGLYKAAGLAKKFEMLEDRGRFLSKLREGYSDSKILESLERESLFENKYDSRLAGAVVNLREKSYFVELLDFKKPSKDELSVDLLIDGKSENLGLDSIVNLTNKASLQVAEINDEDVKLEYSGIEKKGIESLGTKPIQLDLDKHKQEDVDGVIVKLVNINLEKQAKLVLDSEVRGPRALANFSFKIGIEKRGIKLSPEKTEEMIQNMEESIEKWEDINEKLGKVVKGLKGACFAASAMLNVKNLLQGFSGRGLARNEAMTKPGGWNDYCEREFSDGKYSSVQKCLLENNARIEEDVGIGEEQIKNTNDKLAEARKGLVEKTGILDFEGQVKDREEMEKRFRVLIKGDCEKCREELKLQDSFCAEGNFDDIKEISTLCNTWKSAEGSDVLKNASKLDLDRIARNARNQYDVEQARLASAKLAEDSGWDLKRTDAYGETKVPAFIKTMAVNKGDIKKGEEVIMYFIAGSFMNSGGGGVHAPDGGKVDGKDVIIKLNKNKNDYTYENDFYILSGEKLNCTGADKEDCAYVKDYLASQGAHKFIESDAKAYENKMSNPDKLMVKYFDRAPYKGLPAEIPFDVENGWYVEFEYVLSGFGKPYDESGRAINYYICNVGENGLIEFKRKADDICRYYNGVSDELGFPGMKAGESRKLVSRARNAVADAVRYYGKKEAIINGRKFGTGISFGGEAGRCSDFMSPQDCHIMFNLCDPVICPSSRCDLGGEFPVDNVIQTGIIGSLTLCLPNLKEGIMIPVCLSGVHAGIEGYVSILRAHRECLNESLETGRNIGICDEIKSIYLCEFFWRQLVPFMDVLIPKIIESFYKQGVRGGGEYLTVQSAWDNTQNAIDYFREDYAVNSMKAFTMRSTEEAGGEICKSFVSTRYPTDFDLLTEPDSPVQYHAWFDENVLTTATPYPTSHYKVYYHIYAGNDQGAYYVIYLKDITEEFSSYYTYTPERYVVDRGYVALGSHVDRARDFTGPSGYKQLCVNINGQDECDFGKVSTSYAVNYISDKYAEEQAEQQVTKSKDCVAGTPSLWSAAQPNLQAGAEEFIEPELYNQGIVRVCSTYNPGKQVDAKGEYDTANSTFDRWKDVGYCDDPTLRCWLDTESVKDVIKNKKLEGQVLREVDTSTIADGYLVPEESKTIANEAEKFIDDESKKIIEETDSKEQIENKIRKYIGDLTKLANYGPSNAYRARGLLLLGELYRRIAEETLGVYSARAPNPPGGAAVGGGASVVSAVGSGDFALKSNKIYYNGENTNLYLEKKGSGYLIYDGKSRKRVGTLIRRMMFDFSEISEINDKELEDFADKLDGATISGDKISLRNSVEEQEKKGCGVNFYWEGEETVLRKDAFSGRKLVIKAENCEDADELIIKLNFVFKSDRREADVIKSEKLTGNRYEISWNKLKRLNLPAIGTFNVKLLDKSGKEVASSSFELTSVPDEDPSTWAIILE